MSILEVPRPTRPTVEIAGPRQIRVFDTVAAALPAWEALAAIAPHSVYQTPQWLAPWIETVGCERRVKPAFVLVETDAGVPLAFLPLGTQRKGPFTVSSFLGGADSNSALGLFRPGVSWSRSELLHVFREAARLMRPRPTLFVLANGPDFWDGEANPLRLLGGEPSASFLHRADLGQDAEAFFRETLSADTRKKLRAKRRKLEALGPVVHCVAQSPEEAAKILDVFFEQKLARFSERGISSGFDTPGFRAFMEQAIEKHGLELHALRVGERIVATYAGGTQGRRFQAMVNSFDSDPEIARSSPGDLLLMAMIERLVAAGITTLDLGIGEARYKDTWCRRIEPIFDLTIPVGPLGHALEKAEKARRAVKRTVKRNARLYTALLGLRQTLKGRRRRAEPAEG